MNTPLVAYFKVLEVLSPQFKEEKEHMSHISYANAIASMMYAIVFTHLDISHAVSMVSRYTSTLSKKH